MSDVVVDAGVFRLLQRFEPARVDKPREGQTVRMFDEVITMLLPLYSVLISTLTLIYSFLSKLWNTMTL